MASTDGKKALVGNSVGVPRPLLNMNVSGTFLSKTYDMVDDPATDEIISWGPMDNSFIVRDQAKFTEELLPKYFKHNKFPSFTRQLNNYGFQKPDPDWLVFVNKDFLRGQRHLLSNIVRGKPAHGQNQQPQQPPGQSSTVEVCVEVCVEVGKSGLEEEVERLKRDINVLVEEHVELRKEQKTTDTELQAMGQRLHGMGQMISLLSKAVDRPDLLAQVVEKQNESSGFRAEGSKKRRFKPDVVTDNHPVTPVDGQIFNNKSYMNDGSTAMFSPMMLDASHQLETYGTVKTFPEVSPIVGSQKSSAVNLSSKNMLMHECRLSVAPEGNGDDGGFLNPTYLTTDENITPDINSLSLDSEIDWDSFLIDDLLKPIDPQGGQLPVSSPLATDAAEMDTTAPAAPLLGT